MIPFCTFSVLLTLLVVFRWISDSAFLMYYKSASFPVFTGRSTKHPNVCNSSLITKQPDSPGGGGTAGLLLCFWSELYGADCRGTARHFSALNAANLQIAPCSPKRMEGQFGGSKGLKRSTPCAPIILWVWIYFLTSAARCPLSTFTFLTPSLPLSAAHRR